MKHIVIKLALLFLCVLSNERANSQIQQNKIDSAGVINELDALKKRHSFNKNIPVRYELEILKALSFFPELDSVYIAFKVQKIKTTLNTRPTIGSLFFRRKSKRKYIIRIDESTAPDKVTLRDANFNARIGVFGHEFNHIIDYTKKGTCGVLGRGLDYSSKKRKERFEKEIDFNTIERGLGWQLYEWSSYILNESNGTEKYKAFKREIYLEPEEIKERIERETSNESGSKSIR